MRTKKGVVTSTKMEKTIVVSEYTYKFHPKYNKKYKVTKKFYAHDENGDCSIGDKVTIKETIPLSKLKRWALLEKVS